MTEIAPRADSERGKVLWAERTRLAKARVARSNRVFRSDQMLNLVRPLSRAF